MSPELAHGQFKWCQTSSRQVHGVRGTRTVAPKIWVDPMANFSDSVVNKGSPLFVGSTNRKQGYLRICVAPQWDMRWRACISSVWGDWGDCSNGWSITRRFWRPYNPRTACQGGRWACFPWWKDHASCIVYIPSNHVSDSQNIPSLKLSAIFCRVLSVIFRYTAATLVSSVVASLDFTSKFLTTSWVKQACFQLS